MWNMGYQLRPGIVAHPATGNAPKVSTRRGQHNRFAKAHAPLRQQGWAVAGLWNEE
jgi:hypothetical protein